MSLHEEASENWRDGSVVRALDALKMVPLITDLIGKWKTSIVDANGPHVSLGQHRSVGVHQRCCL